MKKLLYLILVLLCTSHTNFAQTKPLLSKELYQKALQYFKEAKELSDKDGGKLWNKPLYGPMIFIKVPESILIANEADPEGYLKPQGKLYVGKFPKNIGVANTAQKWNGKTWTTVIWYRFSPTTRTTLFMHELFHRIQPTFELVGNTNQHLDEKEARTLIRLEWNALLAAYLRSQNPQTHKAAIEDIRAALIFKARRHQLYTGSYKNELALQLNEGLAEYTGLKLSGLNKEQANKALTRNITNSKNRRTLVRSFAYISGPLYGFLLDSYVPKWRTKLAKNKGMADILQNKLSLNISDKPRVLKKQVKQLGKNYKAKEIRNYENDRETKRRQVLKKYQASLVAGKVMKITLGKNFRYNFDPNTLVPLKNKGIVYPTITVRDTWGILRVNKEGALMSADKTSIIIPAKDKFTQVDNKLETKNWVLELKKGWKVSKEGKNWVLKAE